MLVRLRAVHLLIDGEQNAARQPVLFVEQERRRPDQQNVTTTVRISPAAGEGMPIDFALGLNEEAEVRLRIIELQRWRPIPVHDAVIADVAPLIALAREALFISRARPEVMPTRCVARCGGE